MALTTLRILLGLYPKTEEIENQQNSLVKEYEDFKQFAQSEELARFVHLSNYVASSDFTDRKNHYAALVFKGSPEEQKEQEYKRLKNWHEIKFYYKFKASSNYAVYLKTIGSDEMARYEQLKALVESEDFKKKEAYLKDKKKFEKTDEYHKYLEYKSLFENHSFKNYFRFVANGAYPDFAKLYKSTEVEQFHELEKYIQSEAFKTLKAGKEFKGSEAAKKEADYTAFKASAAYKHYLKLSGSEQLHDYKKIHNSQELAYFKELEAFVKSEAFQSKKKQTEALTFETSEENKKLQEFHKLLAKPEIKTCLKVKTSEQLNQFNALDGSDTISKYESLEKEVLSDEFKSRKAYLLDTKKWEKTDEYKQYAEYLALKKSEKITWYFKLKDSKKFDSIDLWNLAFEDDFKTGSLDRSKWLTRYFWGEVLLHDTYALPGEHHLFTDGKNIEFSGSAASIVTKAEKTQGKEWNPMLGFLPREFDYTSGLISSASSFRTKYGKIEAKIKMPSTAGTMHAFWLAGESMLPQVDVFKMAGNKLHLSSFWGNIAEEGGVKKETSSLSASKFANNYFIYTLEWSADKIEWKINNLVVKTQTANIPTSPLYVVLSSGVVEKGAQTPARMEIDWIRCYQSKA